MDRTSQRQWIIKVIYELHFYDEDEYELEKRLDYHGLKDEDFILKSIKSIIDNKEEINKLIENNLYGWKMNRLAIVDKAILQVSINEFVIQKSVPNNVSISEAVENAKIFSDSDSYKFINGVLSSINKGL